MLKLGLADRIATMITLVCSGRSGLIGGRKLVGSGRLSGTMRLSHSSGEVMSISSIFGGGGGGGVGLRIFTI